MLSEDEALGKLPDSQFQKLLCKYQEEHDILREQIRFLDAVVKGEQAHEMEVNDFLKVVRKYTRVNQITSAILREFIHHIVCITGKQVSVVCKSKGWKCILTSLVKSVCRMWSSTKSCWCLSAKKEKNRLLKTICSL